MPGGQTASPSRAPSLPPDLLRQAVHRLGLLCLGLAVTALLGVVWRRNVAVAAMPIDPQYMLGSNGMAVVLAVLGVAIFAASRRRTIDAERLLLAGLAYEVLSAFGIAMSERLMFDFGAPPQRASFTMFVFLTFPFLVPTRMSRRVITTFMAWAMLPLAFVVAQFFGRPMPELAAARATLGPTALAALLGVLGSRVVFGLATAVQKARRLGAYELVERLGEGGMGEVWRARHRLLKRPAAIKLIRPAALGDDAAMMIARFEREAQATAQLRSPHTIELYDFGSADDGTFYFVMELLNGYDLEVFVSRFGPMPPARALHVLDQICRSLREAHRHGIVHRDLKPANILVCQLGDEADFVKVLDFGLVKLPEHDLTVAESESGSDSLMGTPAYMAPEVTRGEVADAHADVYALACVAYWLLTGRRVFIGANALATMLMHAQNAPTPPSAVTETPIPDALEALIMRCLHKSPDARPADAAALQEALAPIIDAHPWPAAGSHRWWTEHATIAPPPPGDHSDGFATTFIRSDEQP